MPSLTYFPQGATQPKVFPLYKRITTIGKAIENDIALPDAQLADTHAHIIFDGLQYTVTSLIKGLPLHVNHKKVRTQPLKHQDQIQLGDAEVVFHLVDAPGAREGDLGAAELEAYRKMVEFSRRLSGKETIDELLATLLDAVIELTRADKGMVILLEGGVMQVKAARNLKRENIDDAVRQVSDSIIAKVIQTRRPVIVSDALHDDQFCTSVSVVNLKLCSVMATPLLEKGNLFGVLYVGNDSVINLFEQRSLEILTLFAAQASLLVQNALLLNELRWDNRELSDRLEHMRFGELIGASEAMREVFAKIEKLAPTNISVLITGETGTGKELVARRLHSLSPRAKGPFVSINCGAIPENLLESELFGHVKGAFTGAVATRPGRFQCAECGTLFLDEIGELPLHLQVKLLRALQERTVTKVGENRPETVDIRVVSASHRDLEAEIKVGRFREDLYYRIQVVNLHLPPLRNRGEDVALIGRYLLSKYAAEFHSKVRGFAPSALVAMRRHSWPGNIRELENKIKKAVVLAERTLLGPEDLELSHEDFEPIKPLHEAREEFQHCYVAEVLARNNGNRTKTAKDLGVDPRTIFRYLEKMEDDGDDAPS